MCAFLSQATHIISFYIMNWQPHTTDFSCFFRSDRGSREGQALNREAEVLSAGKSLLSATMEKVQKAATVKYSDGSKDTKCCKKEET